MMSSARIKVALRARDFLSEQTKKGYTNSYISFDSNAKQVLLDNGDDHLKRFSFDQLLLPSTTQEQVYSACNIGMLVDKVIEGYHSTILAYGQTSSGKTYTMDGYNYEGKQGPIPPRDHRDNGLVPRIIHDLFRKTQAKSDQRTFSLYVSYLQIYNQKILDLLNLAKDDSSLRLRWTKSDQFVVENLFVFQCKSKDEMLNFFLQGLRNRITASHKLNASSSRSHAILTIRVQSFDNKNPSSILTSKLQLVDLAGSQRIGLTGAEGKQAKESIDINKSLFTLRLVINTLAQQSKNRTKQFVPYRDSKLTSILKQSIGGNSYCLMIACITPNDTFVQQNISTLTYATKTAFITNKPVKNDDPRNRIIDDLRVQVHKLTTQLGQANQHIRIMNDFKQSDINGKLKQQNRQRQNMSQLLTPGSNNDNFSQNLIDSIRMVRQLLKSNKELRQQLQDHRLKNQQNQREIFSLQKENQELKQKQARPPTRPISKGRGLSQQKHYSRQSKRQEQKFPRAWNTAGQGFGAISSGLNLQSLGSVEINQFFVNQTGMDSMPTNFNKRQVNTSQGERRLQRYRHAMTAAGGRRPSKLSSQLEYY